jgi:short-subunit dehydrogenase
MYYYVFCLRRDGKVGRDGKVRLDGKVVLITGASEGIGAACAQAFRDRGARLALTARTEEKLRQVAGSDGFAYAADLLAAGSCTRIVAAAMRHFGRIDVLVNSAGVGLYTPACQASLAQAHALFDLNFFATLEMVQHVAIVMRSQRSGTIVNISSIAGMMTLPWFTLYSASKHAVCALTDGLRMELRPHGIHAMCVCPGYVSTNFQSHAIAGTPPAALRRSRPLAITPAECAKAVVRGVERNARIVVTPRRGWFAVIAARLLPGVVDRRLERMYREGS